MQAALRPADAASALCAAGLRVTLENAFGDEYDPIAAKLIADVCGFLVSSAGLDPEFRVQARAFILAEPVAGEALAAGAGSEKPAPSAEEASDNPHPAPAAGTEGAADADSNDSEARGDMNKRGGHTRYEAITDRGGGPLALRGTVGVEWVESPWFTDITALVLFEWNGWPSSHEDPSGPH